MSYFVSILQLTNLLANSAKSSESEKKKNPHHLQDWYD